MEFELNEEQDIFRKSIRELAQGVIAPRAEEIDEKAEFPADICEQLAKYGWLGLVVPENYGGSGASALTACMVIEEVARCCASSALILVAHFLGLAPIVIAGSEEQKSKFLPKLAAGEALAALARGEPGSGLDSEISATAVLEGGRYRLNGTKSLVSNGGVADIYTVFAKTDPSLGVEGMSAFIVEKSTPGFKVGQISQKLGIRGNPSAEIVFEDCLVPKENLLGKEGDGYRILVQARDAIRPQYGAQAVGLAQGALEAATSYAKERVQFKQPLAAFPAIQFKLAEMAMHTEASRQLVYKAADAVDRDSKELKKLSPMAKCFASDSAVMVAGNAMQILGAYGYMREYPIERMLRDAKVIQIYEGTSESQRLATAREVLA